jgi:inorganic pyrophosphatase
MDLTKMSPGAAVPEDINVIIEIPMNALPIKYEMDKDSGVLKVDRFLSTAMSYPCNYGFIPNTLSEDGDPIDVLVVTPVPLVHGCMVRSRPIGMLEMEDESGIDMKILAVPVSKLCKTYEQVTSYQDLPESLLNMIKHFFEHYKDLEKGKWVKLKNWMGVNAAYQEIEAGIKRHG